MFEKVGVPILGVVENMSYFLCPHCAGAARSSVTAGRGRRAGRWGSGSSARCRSRWRCGGFGRGKLLVATAPARPRAGDREGGRGFRRRPRRPRFPALALHLAVGRRSTRGSGCSPRTLESFVRTSRSCRTPIWSARARERRLELEAQLLEHPLRARLRLHHLGHHLLEARLQGVENSSLARMLPNPSDGSLSPRRSGS